MKLLHQESRNALSTQARGAQQLANPRRANGARPGLGHLALPSLPSRTTGSGPAWSDGTRHEQATTMPNWLGGCRVGEPSLDFLRHPARLRGLPLSPGPLQRRADNRRPLVPAWPPGSLLAPGSCVVPAPTASPGSRRNGNGASAEGLAPRCEGPVFRPSPSFLTGWSSR